MEFPQQRKKAFKSANGLCDSQRESEKVEMRFYIRKLCWTGEEEIILNRITEKASERARRDKLFNKVSPQPLPLAFKLITNDSPIIVQRADENNIK